MSKQLSSASFTVVLVGATGTLGKEVADVFLSSYRSYFPHIIATVRDSTTAEAKVLSDKGAELVQLDQTDLVASFTKAFQGADVVVNLLGTTPHAYRDAVGEAAIKSGVKVYFPPEFGTDHRINDFPGWDHAEWIFKGQHAQKYRELGAGKTKVIAVYTGAFLEIFLSPWLGFDTANLTYTCYGSPDVKVSTTSMADIGRAIAELALLALNPETAATVPDDVRIAGDTRSCRDVKEIVQRVRRELGVEPSGEIKLVSLDLADFREKIRAEHLQQPKEAPLDHGKILFGEGKADFSENNNRLVNPGQSIWKWKTVEDVVHETGGKPFC
ncbi:NAD(P)-binding protein [Daedalea quercina L-15889]|uniref:NAD(P)-binding protein n=1 Tax=Daedalea quercina L-15889 TaxID=1314783 RepID=A0A165LBB4_9APHY|nr:NAD(P)-binding protein [Daedalea quercina L-15889]